MWKEMARVIHEVRPRFVFVENSPMLTSRGLGTVLGDLASMGFDARWGVLGAADVGAPHQRDRIWIVGKDVAFSKSKGSQGRNNERHSKQRQSRLGEGGWSVQGNWSIEPNVGRVANGVASRVDRLKAIGNGQVSEVARRAWEVLSGL
jgi:DNA (cytosine-5)-methyltransferase 1